MKLQAVTKKYKVYYPDKYEVILNEMLLKHQPMRWRKSRLAGLVFSALLATQLAGCTKPEQADEVRKMNMAPIFERNAKAELMSSQSGVFILLGNYPLTLPSLTEERALAIITKQLQSSGLKCEATQKQVAVEPSPISPLDKADHTEKQSVSWQFDMEIMGAKEPVYVEFMPDQENEKINKKHLRTSLQLPLKTKEAAVALRKQLSEVRDESTGVIFYEAAEQSGLLNEEENLKRQVDDFILWLKTTGLI